MDYKFEIRMKTLNNSDCIKWPLDLEYLLAGAAGQGVSDLSVGLVQRQIFPLIHDN